VCALVFVDSRFTAHRTGRTDTTPQVPDGLVFRQACLRLVAHGMHKRPGSWRVGERFQGALQFAQITGSLAPMLIEQAERGGLARRSSAWRDALVTLVKRSAAEPGDLGNSWRHSWSVQLRPPLTWWRPPPPG